MSLVTLPFPPQSTTRRPFRFSLVLAAISVATVLTVQPSTIIDHKTSGECQALTSGLCTKIDDYYHESASGANSDLETHGPYLFTVGLVPVIPGSAATLVGTHGKLTKRSLPFPTLHLDDVKTIQCATY